MDNDIVKLQTNAELFVGSGLFQDTKTAREAMVKIMAGQELGFMPMQSMQNIDIIKGRVFLKPSLLGTLIKKSGKYTYKIVEHSDKGCKLEFFEITNGNRESCGFSEFTAEDAKKLGLMDKDNYRKQAKNMFFHRALSQGARYFCLDVINMPIYSDGDVILDIDGKQITKLQQATIFSLIKRELIDDRKIEDCLRFFGKTQINELLTNEYNDFVSMLNDKSVVFEEMEVQ